MIHTSRGALCSPATPISRSNCADDSGSHGGGLMPTPPAANGLQSVDAYHAAGHRHLHLGIGRAFQRDDQRVGDHRQLRPAPRRCRSPGNARRWTAPHGWPAASPASTITPNTPHGGPKSTVFPNRSGSTACGVLAQSERCANSVLVKRIIRASGVLRGLTSCRYSWPMVGGTLQSVTSHESVLLVDAALL